MSTLKNFKAILVTVVVVAAIVAGCGSSDDDVATPSTQNQNLGSAIQVQFNRNNVLAQAATIDGFANADTYGVSIIDPNTNEEIVLTTYVAADLTQNLQTVIVTNLSPGTYEVVVTAFLNNVQTAQVSSPSVEVASGVSVSIGTGSNQELVVYAGSYTPATPDQGTTGGTSATNTTGGTSATNTTGGTSATNTTGGTSATTSGTSGGYTTGTTGGY